MHGPSRLQPSGSNHSPSVCALGNLKSLPCGVPCNPHETAMRNQGKNDSPSRKPEVRRNYLAQSFSAAEQGCASGCASKSSTAQIQQRTVCGVTGGFSAATHATGTERGDAHTHRVSITGQQGAGLLTVVSAFNSHRVDMVPVSQRKNQQLRKLPLALKMMILVPALKEASTRRSGQRQRTPGGTGSLKWLVEDKLARLSPGGGHTAEGLLPGQRAERGRGAPQQCTGTQSAEDCGPPPPPEGPGRAHKACSGFRLRV